MQVKYNVIIMYQYVLISPVLYVCSLFFLMQSPMYVYHVCPTERCQMVYRGVYADDLFCPLCQTPRYIGGEDNRRPAKLMYYISIIGFVKQIFQNEEFVK